jgi:hypothetical protein
VLRQEGVDVDPHTAAALEFGCVVGMAANLGAVVV